MALGEPDEGARAREPRLACSGWTSIRGSLRVYQGLTPRTGVFWRHTRITINLVRPQEIVVCPSSTAPSVLITPNPRVRMIVSATIDGGHPATTAAL